VDLALCELLRGSHAFSVGKRKYRRGIVAGWVGDNAVMQRTKLAYSIPTEDSAFSPPSAPFRNL
jgi:hypothetical protein